MRGGSRPGAGRKPVVIDLLELERLAALHCTDEDIAGFLGISVRTIQNRRKRADFAEAERRGRAKGRISVRRSQMKLLEKGNAAMAVWLGKQLLGQRDVTPLELRSTTGRPIEVSMEVIDAILNDEKQNRKV